MPSQEKLFYIENITKGMLLYIHLIQETMNETLVTTKVHYFKLKQIFNNNNNNNNTNNRLLMLHI